MGTSEQRGWSRALRRLGDRLERAGVPVPRRAAPSPPTSARLPRVCVVGAGSSGLPVVKALRDAGISFDCFERSDRVGGNWVFRNRNQLSSAYRSLHINTSRDRMQYADYPMPRDYPDFPHHSLIARYFEAYVDHFGLREHITFERTVEHIAQDPDHTWRVRLDDGTERRYDAVAVANGHHWDPQWPNPPFPGHFDGVEMHSHDYIDPSEPHELVGKRVVVVGMGNSAMDIACELGRPGVAERVFLSARRGAWVIPHYLFGKPLDQTLPMPPWVPWQVRRRIAAFIHRTTVGPMERFGLPRPDHDLGQAHPTISSDLLPRLGRGDILPKPNIAQRLGDRVRFADGSVEPVDVIIYCTGYKVTFPFFDRDFISAPDNDLPLFRRVFRPGLDSLFFIGLLQPLGAVMPLAEAQAKWVADYLTGRYHLPADDRMRADMARERAAMFRRYVPSRRHTMQVDFDDYLHDLAAERDAGRARAAAAGWRLPVPARTDDAAPARGRAPAVAPGER